MVDLIGTELYSVWEKLCAAIDAEYEMERLWNPGGKAWTYEYKYRRCGKTLCALYAKEEHIGFMIILGTVERERFEAGRKVFSEIVQNVYDSATIYHDRKRILLEPTDTSQLDDFIRLLHIKRKPNRTVRRKR